MKTAHQNAPSPQDDQDVANKKYVDDNAGGGSTLVFRPGSGSTGPVVFDDFNDLYDNALGGALASGGGTCTILIDDINQSPAVLDPGVGNIVYDFTGVRLVGIDPHRQIPLNVLAGSGESNNLTITGASYFECLLVRSSGSDTAFNAQNNQEIVLKNATFNGAGQYAYDFLNVSGCVLHLGDESRLQRTSNAAIRVNGNALTIHVDGARVVIDYLGAAGFVGGSINVVIGSASARVDKQQDILLQTFTMSAASGFWNGDPNGDLSATEGTLVSDQNTAVLWKNTDGATAWTQVGGGGGSGVELDYQPPLGTGPSTAMQFQPLDIHPDGSKVYVGSNNTAEIWRILTASNTWDPAAPQAIAIAATIQWPNFFVLNADGSKLYVATTANMTAITVIDTATNAIIGTVSGLSGSNIASMKMHPNGTELWVHQNPNIVDRVNVATDAVIGTFAGGFTTNTYDAGFSAGGTKYYVTGRDATGVTTVLRIYSTSTYTQVASFASATQLIGPCALPNNSEMWFTAWDIGDSIVRIYRFSVATNAQVGTPIATTFDNSSSYFMVAKPDSSKVYLLQAGSGDVNVVSVSGLALTNTISLGGGNYGDLEINPSGTFLYVSSGSVSPSWVKVIDLLTETVVDTITSASATPPPAVTVGTFATLLITGARLTDEGGGTGGVKLPVVFDNGTAPYQNIKANRQSGNASTNDPTKTGITNFGSNSTASGDYAAIPGGNNNTASGMASVAMGNGSTASGIGSLAANAATAGGDYSAAFNNAVISAGAQASVAFTDGNIGANSYGCTALNNGSTGANCNYCHAEGSGYVDAGANKCHVEGNGTYVAPNISSAHAEGNGCTVEADSGHAEGDGCQVSINAFGAHAEGGGTTASGQNSHAEGTGSDAIGYYSHAEGGATTAQGEGSHSEGDGCFAEGNWSHAQGSDSHAFRETQFAHGGGSSGGFGNGVGVAQTSWLQMRNQAPTNGPGASEALRYGVLSGGVASITLQNLRAYNFKLTAIVNGTAVGPVYKTRTFKLQFNARCVAGVAIIAGSGASEEYGDAATWTIVPSAVGNTIVLTLNTGADTHQCYVSAQLEFVEARF